MTADGNGDTPVRVCRIPYPIANMGSLKFVGTASLSNAASGTVLTDVIVQADGAAGTYADPELCISFTAKKNGGIVDQLVTYTELGTGYVKFSVTYIAEFDNQW